MYGEQNNRSYEDLKKKKKSYLKEEFKKKKNDSDVPILVNI